ncbi:MAG TPA: futalosine hydrolase, partial [Solidesulfovibrio magneticus]|nr:futalosine hydrolase [Solidesulfovibrio magneticus]
MPASVSPPGPPRAPAQGRDRHGGSGGVSRFRAAPVLLALATAKEYRAALSPLGAPAPPPPGRAAPWRRGGRDFLVLITGVGPVAAAMAVGRAIGEVRGELAGVVNLGICGSFDLAVAPLGAVTATTAAIFPEYGLRRDEGVDARGIAFPQAVIDGCDVYDRLELDPAGAATAMGLALPAQAVAGAGLTVAGVTAS